MARGGRYNNAGGGRRRILVANMRRQQVIEYALGEMTHEQIAQKVGVSRVRVTQIITEEFNLLAKQRAEVGPALFEKRQRQLSEIKREARDVMLRPCPICEGAGGEWKNGVFDPCSVCAATGRFYEVDDRLKALDRLLRALQEEAKIFGDYEASKVNVVVRTETYREEIALMSDEEVLSLIHEFNDIDTLALEAEDAEFTPLIPDSPLASTDLRGSTEHHLDEQVREIEAPDDAYVEPSAPETKPEPESAVGEPAPEPSPGSSDRDADFKPPQFDDFGPPPQQED